MKKELCIVLLLTLFQAGACMAHSFDVYTQLFNADDGLPSPEVYDVHSDADGYIWFCTDRGIGRYNGYEFESFRTDNSALTSNTVFKVFEAPNHDLWFTCYDASIAVFDWSSQTFHHFNQSRQLRPGDRGWAQTILFKGEEVFVLYTYGTAVGVFDSDRQGPGYLVDYKDFFGEAIQEPNGGSSFFLPKNGTHAALAEIRGERRISGELIQQGDHYFCYYDTVVYEIAPGEVRVKQVFDAQINYLYEDEKGQIYALTTQGVKAVGAGHHEKNFLAGVSVTGICTDLDGNTWLSTIQRGALQVPDFSIRRSKPDELSTGQEQALSLNRFANHLVIGTSFGNVYSLDSNEHVTCFNHPYGGYRPMPVNRMIRDSDRVYTLSGYYLATRNNELVMERLDTSVDRYSNFLFPYSDDTVLSFGLFPGFRIFSRSNGSYYDRFIPTYNVEGRVYDIEVDNQGTHWVAAQSGVWKWPKSHPLRAEIDTSNPWLRGRVNQILKLHNGELAFATLGQGISIRSKEAWHHLGEAEGLPSNLVQCLEQVTPHEFWLGTNKGVAVVRFNSDDKAWKVIKTLTTTDGLIANYIRDMKLWRGRLWLASEGGVFSLDPFSEGRTARAPVTRITGVATSKGQYEPEHLHFSVDENQIMISYLALCYSKPNHAFYQYRVDGSTQGEWNNMDDRTVYLMNLAPGDYTFHVRSRSRRSEWGRADSFQFHIPLSFWKTSTFKTLVFAAFLVIVVVVFRWRQREFRNRISQQKRLDDLEFKFKEAELAALRSQMNPHFVFNALNSIQRYIMTQQPEVAGDYLARFGKLIRNSLKYSKLDMIDLDEEVQFLTDYLEIEHKRFPGRFNYRIEVSEKLKGSQAQIPPLLLQPICENAIKHAFTGDKEDGYVKVTIESWETDLLKIVIEDNGVGIASAKASKFREMEDSYGLDIVANRIKLLREIGFKASMEIQDVSLSSQGTGTRVELILPSE